MFSSFCSIFSSRMTSSFQSRISLQSQHKYTIKAGQGPIPSNQRLTTAGFLHSDLLQFRISFCHPPNFFKFCLILNIWFVRSRNVPKQRPCGLEGPPIASRGTWIERAMGGWNDDVRCRDVAWKMTLVWFRSYPHESMPPLDRWNATCGGFSRGFLFTNIKCLIFLVLRRSRRKIHW